MNISFIMSYRKLSFFVIPAKAGIHFKEIPGQARDDKS